MPYSGMRIPSVLALLSLSQALVAAPAIEQKDFPTLHALMQPTAEELKWQQIPWQTNLWDARRLAAETGKPIYLWEMDGHPLGCT